MTKLEKFDFKNIEFNADPIQVLSLLPREICLNFSITH